MSLPKAEMNCHTQASAVCTNRCSSVCVRMCVCVRLSQNVARMWHYNFTYATCVQQLPEMGESCLSLSLSLSHSLTLCCLCDFKVFIAVIAGAIVSCVSHNSRQVLPVLKSKINKDKKAKENKLFIIEMRSEAAAYFACFARDEAPRHRCRK